MKKKGRAVLREKPPDQRRGRIVGLSSSAKNREKKKRVGLSNKGKLFSWGGSQKGGRISPVAEVDAERRGPVIKRKSRGRMKVAIAFPR